MLTCVGDESQHQHGNCKVQFHLGCDSEEEGQRKVDIICAHCYRQRQKVRHLFKLSKYSTTSRRQLYAHLDTHNLMHIVEMY